MSYLLTLGINDCISNPGAPIEKHPTSEVVTFSIEISIAAIAAAVAGLSLVAAQYHLPLGEFHMIGTIPSYTAQMVLLGAGSLIVVDLIAFAVRSCTRSDVKPQEPENKDQSVPESGPTVPASPPPVLLEQNPVEDSEEAKRAFAAQRQIIRGAGLIEISNKPGETGHAYPMTRIQLSKLTPAQRDSLDTGVAVDVAVLDAEVKKLNELLGAVQPDTLLSSSALQSIVNQGNLVRQEVRKIHWHFNRPGNTVFYSLFYGK